MMTGFETGQDVGVRATIFRGPFPDESMVSIVTPSGQITGFVSNSHIDQTDENNSYVRAVIQSIEGDEITILLAGSFFTTAGLATLPTGWARENLALAEV